jgi:ribonuclease III
MVLQSCVMRHSSFFFWHPSEWAGTRASRGEPRDGMSEPESSHPWQDEEWLGRVREFGASLDIAPEHAGLVVQALTHRSLSEEAPGGDNERLEFLGDSVLALLVNDYLFRSYPGHTEGQLTKLKATYVSEPSLAQAAAALDLGSLLAIAPSDEAAGGRTRPSTLSDTFEAVLAALYLSRGLEAARQFVLQELIGRTDPTAVWDHKSRLQEMLQEKYRITPSYRTVVKSGPAHDRVFHSEVLANEQSIGQGTGRSKKIAEQAAAEDALARLESSGFGVQGSGEVRGEE